MQPVLAIQLTHELIQRWIRMALPAYREVALIAAHLNLLSGIHRLAFGRPQRHRRLALAEPADRLHLLDLVGIEEHMLAALEQLVLEVILQTEAHDRHIQLIDDPNQLRDTFLLQELAFIDKHTGRLRGMPLYNGEDIGIIVDRNGLPPHTDSRTDIADLISIIYSRGENNNMLVLLLIIMSDLQYLNRLTAVHCSVLEK